ncbi:MAG: SMC-Scp complex subunit ScpB [Elusimicrobia bacterium]|nr:SMC-Scp complex subunit ScpB [Elusimicrobiota bacterium]
MEKTEVKRIVEALLFAADQPIPEKEFKAILGEILAEHTAAQLIAELSAELERNGSPVEIKFIAGGWQMSTRKEFSSWIRRLYREKTTLKLSHSALETLSVIAYKQPMTRSEIEEIRGVECGGVLETILERGLVKIIGRKETIGRPLLYGTTQEFLKHFGLGHLSELPSIADVVLGENLIEKTENTPELPFAGAPADELSAAISMNSSEVVTAELQGDGENVLP